MTETVSLIAALVLATTICLVAFDYVWRLVSCPIRKVAPLVVVFWFALLTAILMVFMGR